jgi:hypothetical protein
MSAPDLGRAHALFIDHHPPNIAYTERPGFRTILFSDPGQCAESLAAIFPLM